MSAATEFSTRVGRTVGLTAALLMLCGCSSQSLPASILAQVGGPQVSVDVEDSGVADGDVVLDAASDVDAGHNRGVPVNAPPKSPVGTPASGDDVGCADGTRDRFFDVVAFPNIAGCAGGWDLPGVFPEPARSTEPTCATTGDDSLVNTSGAGCASSNLCAPGWHICRGGEVSPRTGGDGCNADPAFRPFGDFDMFYAASVSGPGCFQCALDVNPLDCSGQAYSCSVGCHADPTLTNDIFGCGTMGANITDHAASCDGLTRSGNDGCISLPHGGWSCGAGDVESSTITRRPDLDPTNPGEGGVICCR